MSELDEDMSLRLLEASLIESPLKPAGIDKRRIKGRVFAALGMSPKEGRWSLRGTQWRWTAGSVAAAMALIALTPPVSAALGRVFHFIPGIGSVQSSPYGSSMAVLPGIAKGTWNGNPVHITGVMITSTSVMLEMTGKGSSSLPTRIIFRTTTGRTVRLKQSMLVGTGNQRWLGMYYANGQFGPFFNDLAGVIVIGHRHPGRIPVQLRLAKGVRNLAQLGPTQTHHGVTLTAMTMRSGARAYLTVVGQSHGAFHILDTIPSAPSGTQPNLTIRDPQGHSYRPKPLLRFGPSDQIAFTPNHRISHYQISLPQVQAVYPGSVNVLLPVPQQGSQRIDDALRISGLPFTITSVQRVHEGNWWLRLNLSVHMGRPSVPIIHSFQVAGFGGYSWKVHAQTGAIQSIEVPINPGQHTASVTLSNPQVYIRGPWTFHVQLPKN